VVHDLALAVEEVLANLVRHGYAGTEGPMGLRAGIDGVAVKIEIRDRGIHFDPRLAQPPHLDVPLDERAPATSASSSSRTPPTASPTSATGPRIY
jgi:anti-sigma regulatory factor (Ser/Thr protein kinase)